MLTLLMVVPILAFITYEVVAHFVLHNKGMETLSHLVLRIERKYGLPARVLAGAFMIALTVHIEGGF